MEFATRFDERLAHHGPAAVFLPDREGRLRFDADWTRDVWERCDPAALTHGLEWLLLRDHDTGFVNLVLVTSPALCRSHPRASVRRFDALDVALAARAAYGPAGVAEEPW